MLEQIKLAYLISMRNYFVSDTKRIQHAEKVLSYAEDIMIDQPLSAEEKKIAVIAAILHDVGIKAAEEKYGYYNPRLQEQEGPAIAQVIMESHGETEKLIARVKYIIGGHHTAAKVDGLDFQVLWEADLLVNLAKENWPLSPQDYERAIDRHFKTERGRNIAKRLFT